MRERESAFALMSTRGKRAQVRRDTRGAALRGARYAFIMRAVRHASAC